MICPVKYINLLEEIKMKSMEQVREEFQCPKGHAKENVVFVNESALCTDCEVNDQDYDLGMKKYENP